MKYLKKKYKGEIKRMKNIRLKIIVLKKNGITLSDKITIKTPESADMIIIKFEFRDNDCINHTVHMFEASHTLLCTIKAISKTTKRVLTISGVTPETKICSLIY